jgi:hypothetical protein
MDNITLDDIIKEFGENIQNDTSLLLENISNFCAALSYLTRNIQEMEEKKTIKLLKLIRKLLNKINQNTYFIVETLSNNDENFKYNDFLNGYEENLLYKSTN